MPIIEANSLFQHISKKSSKHSDKTVHKLISSHAKLKFVYKEGAGKKKKKKEEKKANTNEYKSSYSMSTKRMRKIGMISIENLPLRYFPTKEINEMGY